jgi:hypothetical protein
MYLIRGSAASNSSGDPNIPGIPAWEPYSEENGFTMILDDVCRGARHLDDALINFGR